MKRATMIAAAAAFLIAGCDGSDLVKVSRDNTETETQDNEEAALAALWLSGEVTAPQDLYETIRDDLAAIRAAYPYPGGDVNTSIEFQEPWVPSMLLINFTPEAKERIRAGTYTEFYALNDDYEATRLDTTWTFMWDYGSAALHFDGRRNPIALGAVYAALDGVNWAEPNGYIGDWSNVYPWRIEHGMSYLFREGSGDCPAGCISSIFWYFLVPEGGAMEYVGRYEYWVDEEPVWWSDAKVAYYAYKGFGG